MSDAIKREWLHALENLRYDVTRHDPLQGHKQDGTRLMFAVTLDASGQIRMTVTRQIDETRREKRRARAGREYQVFVEQNQVTLINYRLRADDDLGVVLREMEKEIAPLATQP